MTLKPIFKRPEDIISQKVEEKVKVNVENRIKTEVDRVVNERLKEKEDKEKADKANKIAKAVDMAKTLKGESEDKDKMTVAEKEKAEKDRLAKDILCPTCHKGHVHKVETDKSGLVYKCHGDKCEWEAVMVPKNSDYKCSGCGMAIKKPEDPTAIDGCPFCHGTKAVRFDWSKIWNVKK